MSKEKGSARGLLGMRSDAEGADRTAKARPPCPSEQGANAAVIKKKRRFDDSNQDSESESPTDWEGDESIAPRVVKLLGTVAISSHTPTASTNIYWPQKEWAAI